MADESLQNLQNKQTGFETVIVQFKETVGLDSLMHLQPVKRMESASIAGGTQFRIETTDADAIRKQLFPLAEEKGFNIVSLQNESHKLEDVFRQLTGGSSGK